MNSFIEKKFSKLCIIHTKSNTIVQRCIDLSNMIAAVEAVTPVMLLSLDQEISATQL